ncbi:Septin-9 [Bagarius yarrelli]|uniref:Septin-9 n=1 Tax=Bagarius yarrelli TaxID=175774 RepID=A0A556VXL4_BAGYA|nr:Septin-9 [Bagarius yarrelli]
MRRSPSVQRSTISPSVSRQHELSANGAIKPKSHTPESLSRRTEISIGINSKPIESSTSGFSRFNLRKPEALVYNKFSDPQKQSVTFSKTSETTAPIVRTPSNVGMRQLSETTFKRNEPPEISVSKPPEVKSQENQYSSAITVRCSSPNTAGQKSPGDDGHNIEEKGVRMKLTVIDTPGFGDHINNENWTHMQNLKDITSSIHYEVYRVRRLNESNTHTTHTNGDTDAALTHEM